MGHDKELFRGVRAILMREWNPIGVENQQRTADEYDAYVAPISGMILRGDSVAALSDYLTKIERTQMGLPGDEKRARSVASSLLALGKS